MEKVDIKKVRLIYSNRPGIGIELWAEIGQEVPCVEFKMRGDVPQPISWRPTGPIYLCSEPWIQFAPKEWDEMCEEIYQKLVELWNKHHGFEE